MRLKTCLKHLGLLTLFFGTQLQVRAEKTGLERPWTICDRILVAVLSPASAVPPSPQLLKGSINIPYGVDSNWIHRAIGRDAAHKFNHANPLSSVEDANIQILSQVSYPWVADLNGQDFWGYCEYEVNISFK